MGEKKNIDLISMTGGFSGLASSSLGMGKGKSTRKSKQNKPKFKGSDDKKVVKSKGKAPDKGKTPPKYGGPAKKPGSKVPAKKP